MSRFITADRNADYLLPPSLSEWLPEGHLACFVAEIVEQLDLSEITQQYCGRGSKAHHPETLLCLLIYGYANGVFSIRKIERGAMTLLPFAIFPPTLTPITNHCQLSPPLSTKM
jgi:transposase